MKFKYKNCNSLRELHKIHRKYGKSFYSYQRKHHKWELSNPWFVWIEYYMTDLKELQQLYKKITNPFYKGPYARCINLPKILKEIINNYRKEFKLGTLIGLNITNEDYYYLFYRNGKRYCESCVGKLE